MNEPIILAHWDEFNPPNLEVSFDRRSELSSPVAIVKIQNKFIIGSLPEGILVKLKIEGNAKFADSEEEEISLSGFVEVDGDSENFYGYRNLELEEEGEFTLSVAFYGADEATSIKTFSVT